MEPCRTRRRDTKAFYPTSERAVFEVLGLEWIDPTLRNADL
jgi:DNA polymerase IV